MDRNNGGDWPPTSTTDEFAGLVGCALLFQILSKLLRVHVVSAFVDVDELRKSSRLRNGFGGGDEGVWYGHDHIAWLDPARHDRKAKRISPAANRYRVAGAAECGKSLFEFFHHRTTDEAGGMQNLVENGSEFLFHFYVRSNQIEKRNAVCVMRHGHFMISEICSI